MNQLGQQPNGGFEGWRRSLRERGCTSRVGAVGSAKSVE